MSMITREAEVPTFFYILGGFLIGALAAIAAALHEIAHSLSLLAGG